MDDRVTGREHAPEHSGIRSDRQGAIVFGKPAGENNQAAGLVSPWEWSGLPQWFAAGLTRFDPDLIDLEWLAAGVELSVANAASSAHDLDVALFNAPDVAEIVLVGDRPSTDVRNNLDVLVPVKGKSRAGGDFIIIPHDQRPQRPVFGFAMAGERKMMLGFQPNEIASAEFGPWSSLQHLLLHVFE
jgi:hypothetical protein